MQQLLPPPGGTGALAYTLIGNQCWKITMPLHLAYSVTDANSCTAATELSPYHSPSDSLNTIRNRPSLVTVAMQRNTTALAEQEL
jgi:hypothetical protein